MSPSEHIELPPGTSIQGQLCWYRVWQLLGAGGNAVTYLVVATSGPYKGVPLALKLFRRLSAPDRRERFLTEVSFLRKANHPAIMRVFDEGTYYEAPFMVMEYLPQTLAMGTKSRSIRVIEGVSYSLQLLSALKYLSELKPQIVHRDIKPANIFIKGKSCVLGDFGLMKAVDGNDEADRNVFKESIGAGMPFFYPTPDLVAYANGKGPITTASDVFQLGLVMSVVFTGRNPAKRRDHNFAPVELEPLGAIHGAYSGSVAKLLERMLVEDSRKRESAAQMMDGWTGLFEELASKALDLDGGLFFQGRSG